jgi:hypothetical protein
MAQIDLKKYSDFELTWPDARRKIPGNIPSISSRPLRATDVIEGI